MGSSVFGRSLHTADQHLDDDVGHGGGEDESEDVVIHVVSFQVSL